MPRLISREDAFLDLYKKLSADWIIINGDPVAITALAWAIYPTSAPGNADLELVQLSLFPMRSVLIGRKRPELRELLDFKNDPEKWETLFMLTVKDAGDGMITKSAYLEPGVNRELFMEHFVRNLVNGHKEGAR
jgi:hypothetical protein